MMGKIMCIERGQLPGMALLLVMICGMCMSCGDPLYLGTFPDEPAVTEPGGDSGGDKDNEGEDIPDPPVKKELYVTGVEYPDGYNWLPELGAGTVEATLFLMKEGERIVEVKVGEKYNVSADADMHRCVGGHLFTDYSTDGETVIKKDGEEIFRYAGREMIHSMQLDGDDVYTLGTPRNGTGFTLRINGEIVIEKAAANMLTGLYHDGDDIVFAYEEKAQASSDAGYQYHYVVNGREKTLKVKDKVLRVNDIRVIDGEPHYIAEYSLKSYRIYHAGDMEYTLRGIGGNSLTDFCFVYDKGTLFVKGEAVNGNGTYFWQNAVMKGITSNGKTYAWSADAENIYHLSGKQQPPYTSLVIKKGRTETPLPVQYEFMYRSCMAVYDGRCCVAVSDLDKRPAMWDYDGITEYDFNGFFTSVSFQ